MGLQPVYDAAGNTLSDGNYSYTYDAAGRLTGATSTAISYYYNALGQRVAKQKYMPGNDLYYAYDEQGHLLEECELSVVWGGCGPWDSQYYVWLGDIPVATVLEWYEVNQDTGDLEASAPGIFYIHTDHLGTPRRLSDYQDSANTPVWRWDSDPFGVGAENGDPNGTGVYYIFDLRFPGQVYDAETGKHYNYFRDYDPATGRYVESDPIGLNGGSYSTYAYGSGNPISKDDPTGEVPWDGLTRGISPAEVQGLSVMQALNYWWNTPDPCMKKKLANQYGNAGVSGIGLFSLASLIPGPWNLTGDAPEALVEDTVSPAAKVAGFNAAKSVAPPGVARALGVGGKALGYGATLATIWATYENIKAYASSSDCGCGGQ